MTIIDAATVPAAARKADEILDAAATLFAARGFDGTSFRDITAAMGAKRSLILYHFGSKEELWRRAMRRIVGRLDARMALVTLPSTDCPDEERVAAALRAYLDTLVAVPEYGQVLLREGVASGPRLDWIVRNFIPAFVFDFHLSDSSARDRMRRSMRRDMVIGSTLVATALGPLLEGSVASASHVEAAGIYPMSAARRDELVALLTALILE